MFLWIVAFVGFQAAYGRWTLESFDIGELDGDLLDNHFEQWLTEFAVNFDDEEHEYRKRVWKENFHLVHSHNNDKSQSYKLAMNHFAAMTFSEFQEMFHLMAPQPGCSATDRKNWSATSFTDIPDSYDWRDHNVLSKVKNQGKCGSCWAFSTTGGLEARAAIHKNMKLLLSEQQLIDCAGNFDTHGCNGGLPSHAFEYIKYNGGVMTESDYPYKAKSGKRCLFDTGAPTLVQVKHSVNITSYDEDSLTAAIATQGPVSIAYHVGKDFMLYHKGVYATSGCPNTSADVNHAVLAVGYGTELGVPYYVVKNSWGTTFGLDGYFKIKRGVNMCGLSVCNSFPILN